MIMKRKDLLTSALDEIDQYTLPLGYTPKPRDILCAKTKLAFNHAGNTVFRKVLSLCLNHYNDSTCRTARGILIASMAKRLEQNGYRFIKEQNNRWVVLNSQQARSKVGHSLRDAVAQQCRRDLNDKIEKEHNKTNRRNRNKKVPSQDDNDIIIETTTSYPPILEDLMIAMSHPPQSIVSFESDEIMSQSSSSNGSDQSIFLPVVNLDKDLDGWLMSQISQLDDESIVTVQDICDSNDDHDVLLGPNGEFDWL